MCGIAGAAFWDGHADRPIETIVRAMTDRQAHRGPDGWGVAPCVSAVQGSAGPAVAFGHRRLAILDLSDRGAQPMASPRASVWLTYNGEIYNFMELRLELEALGRRFLSRSDTEVILQGYEEWGEAVVDRVRGMFALAIWDGRTEQLLLARDRLGIKPLYLARREGIILFASEIRALLASRLIEPRLDRVALDRFLAHQTVPVPRTLIQDVEMLPPATIVRFDARGRRSERQYWHLLGSANADVRSVSRRDAAARLSGLLAESASLHLMSDVPVGAFLSGGIDSSAVVALMHRAGQRARTFAISFPGTEYDESRYAAAVARAFGSEHTEIPLTQRDLLAQLPDALASVDHPSGDGINTYVVSRAVRAAGVKVALSGLGGDEFFGGYPSFRRLRRIAGFGRLWRHSPRVVRTAAASAVRRAGAGSLASTKTAGLLETDGSVAQAYPVMRQLFARDHRMALLGVDAVAAAEREPDPNLALLEGAAERYPEADLMTLVSFAEARTYMHDVLLRDTDQMSMAHGLEIRVPLLDHRVVECVMGLPESVKQSPGLPKGLLVESLGVPLPDECVQRLKKGFVLPFERWMRSELRDLCEQRIRRLAESEIVRPEAVASLWQSFIEGDSSTTWSRPWALVALSFWLEGVGVTS